MSNKLLFVVNPASAMSRDSTNIANGVLRRSLNKAHVPYNADSLETGRKTGFHLEYQPPPNSDDFEDFNKLLERGDNANALARSTKTARTPVKKRKSQVSQIQEMDMDMDMASLLPATIDYYADTREPSSAHATGNNRAASSLQPIPRLSQVSLSSPPRSRIKLNRSKLSEPRLIEEEGDESEQFSLDGLDDDSNDDVGANNYDNGQDQDELPPSSPKSYSNENLSSPRLANFSAMNHTSEPGAFQSSPYPADTTPISESIKDAIVHGRHDVDVDVDVDNDEESEQQQRSDADGNETAPKKRKPSPKTKSRAQALQTKNNSSQCISSLVGSEDDEGLRRSSRHRYLPLDWWRCEKVVYRRRNSGVSLVPNIAEIIRVPKVPPQVLGKNKRKRGRAKSNTVEPSSNSNPEYGWDDDTPQEWDANNVELNEVVTMKIAQTMSMIKPKLAAGDEPWFYEKTFADADFIASGIVELPQGVRKPNKSSKDNTYIFYVIEGAVNLVLNEDAAKNCILASGASFMIPRGNEYLIENIAKRTSKLFYVQARKLYDHENLNAARAPRRSSSLAASRSKSRAPAPPRSKTVSAYIGKRIVG